MGSLFDFTDGEPLMSGGGNTLFDMEGNMMIRTGDNTAMDMESGDIHFISGSSNDDGMFGNDNGDW